MWNRVLLKERAKDAFKSNYWKCVLVALVLSLVVGGGSSFGTSFNYGRSLDSTDEITDNFDDYNSGFDTDDSYTENWKIEEFEDIEDIQNDLESNPDVMSVIFVVVLIVVLIAVAIGLLIYCLLLAPLEVGCRKFFLENSEGRGQDVGLMGFGFKSDYKNVVKVQFFRGLYTFLWSLLFVIPGVIKSYEYFLVPYLLAENPGMDKNEALETSKKLMYGNKMDTFTLELSFILWHFASAFTLGLAGLFWVNPYVYATEAELYRVFSGKAIGTENPTQEQVDLAKLYGGVKDDGEDVYITFDTPDDTSTFD